MNRNTDYHFISYSAVDALDFALKLADRLEAGPPSIKSWIDQRKLQKGKKWDQDIVESIKNCQTMLFLMSLDSVEDASVCLDECSRALTYKKPIIPLLLQSTVEVPFLVERRQYIDFTGDFDQALAQLRNHFDWLNTDKGRLGQSQDRLADAKRELRRATVEQERDRILKDIRHLETEIERQKAVVANPQAAILRTNINIGHGLDLERDPAPAVASPTALRTVNPAPTIAPSYFQDRHVETRLLGSFLQDDALRIATVTGRGGTGKTAMVCRLLKELEKGQLPEGGGPCIVDGIVYLSPAGAHRIDVVNIYFDLSKLLPDREAEKLRAFHRNPQVPLAAQMQFLVEAFHGRRTVLFLDNFENLVDTEFNISDAALAEALKALLNAPQHGIKVIITTRVAPRDLALEQPGRQLPVPLDEGLPAPFAENILRAMDAAGTFGLKDAPASLLGEARVRTRGYPRALEALFAILAADRSTSLVEILSHASGLLPENVVQALVGEAFSRLDAGAQQVMQALAIYAHPVSSGAVDYLLQPFHPSIDSTPVLNRLVNMLFTRKDAGRYYIHPGDRDYALGRIPQGQPADRKQVTPVFTRYALLDRAAGFFEQARRPLEGCTSLSDLIPQQTEFELRCEGEDYDSAGVVLSGISDLLERWGHFRLLAQCHGRLVGKLSNRELECWNVCQFGWAQDRLGNMEAAAECYRQALALARQIPHRAHQVRALTNLGGAYADLGRATEAEDCLKQALSLAKTESEEYTCFCTLAYYYMQVGQDRLALSYLERALPYARNSPQALPGALCNLACAYGKLGEFDRALKAATDGVTAARKTKDRMSECGNLSYTGIILVDQNLLERAMEHLNQAIELADDLANLQFQNEARQALALACLYAGNLEQARATGEAALQYDARQLNNPVSGLLAFLGVVALRQGDPENARRHFQSAIANADAILTQSPSHCAALDPKGLALAGLALCLDAGHVTAAREAYRAARALTTDRGIVLRALRLFDALAKVDARGILAPCRSDVGQAA